MNKRITDKKIVICTAALLGTSCLSGCGKATEEEQQLAVFSSSIADFKDYIQDTDEKINALDVSKRESADQLLEILDGMDAEFAKYAEIFEAQAPVQYESVPGLAKQASEDMSLAVSYYHTAYESEEFNANYADAAYLYYENSMKAVKCIGYLLVGEAIPEDAQVTVYETTNEEHLLDKWLSGDHDDEAASDVNTEAAE